MSYILIIIGITVLDKASKIIAASNLANISTIPIIKNVFHLTYAENTGMAFSMLSGNPLLLGSISILFIGVLSYYFYKEYKKDKTNKLLFTSLSFIIGGALGNLVDRLFLGYVVDMFDFRLINFAIFNVADIFICIGGFLLILSVLLEPDEKKEI